ncbi:hypothetical protein LVJ94_00835 [Pendulispora rubella]|uniref:Uncharacterized protein n=1 Tax=Pendulispora rubella TaxID=2741070 RepID=A0ABZ2L4K9_9BACT
MRTKASLLFISLFALGACITNSEVGVYPAPREDKPTTPELPPSPTSSDAGTDAAETGQPDIHPVARATNRLAAGARSTCATTSTDGVVCWGDNSSGQLGNGTSMRACPDGLVCPVQGLDIGVDAVFGGGLAHCALRKDSTVFCWGDTVFQQNDDGVYAHHVTYSPRKMPELTNASTVGVGLYFQCALTDGQNTKCYGLNNTGTLGTKSVEEGGTDHGEISGMGKQGRKLAAAQSGYFACAVTGSGALKCWGSNAHGQLGNGTYDKAPEATTVKGLETNVTAVAAGTDHACAVVSGRVKCWGRNDKWQLGSAQIEDRLEPDTVPGLSGVVALTAGRAHTCALTRRGTVYCWGDYNAGGTSASATPMEVISANVTEITAGTSHTCALYTNGSLVCWGSNDYGQLGPFGYRAEMLP